MRKLQPGMFPILNFIWKLWYILLRLLACMKMDLLKGYKYWMIYYYVKSKEAQRVNLYYGLDGLWITLSWVLKHKVT